MLLSFECEHILIWRGRDWKSSIEPNEGLKGLQEVKADGIASGPSAAPSPSVPNLCIMEANCDDLKTTLSPIYSNETQGNRVLTEFGAEDIMSSVPATSVVASHEVLTEKNIDELVRSPIFPGSCDNHSEALNQTVESEIVLDGLVESQRTLENTEHIDTVLDFSLEVPQPHERLNNTKSTTDEQMSFDMPCTEGIMLLRKQAVENGMAVVLDDHSLDADNVFKKAVAFAKTAPTGPVFHRRPKQLGVEKNKDLECDDSGVKEASVVIGTEITVSSLRDERKTSRSKRMEDIKADYLNVVPQGNLRVDELAKLLA